MPGGFDRQLQTLGGVIRQQRRGARLSLRELAARTSVSNAYLSQIERGLHQPSLKVLRSIAEALGVPPWRLLSAAGLLGDSDKAAESVETAGRSTWLTRSTEEAIRADEQLSDVQKDALIGVYRSYLPLST